MKNLLYWLSLVMAWTKRSHLTAEDVTKNSQTSRPVDEGPPPIDTSHLPDLQSLISDCEELGRMTARKTRAIKADAAVLKALEEQATTRARAMTPDRFDDNKYLSDKRTASELTWLDQLRVEQREALGIAAAELRKRDEALATFGPLKPFPKVSLLFKLAANAGIVFSIAPIIHDFLPGLQPLVRWGGSVGFAEAFSFFIVAGAIPAVRPEEAHAEGGRGAWAGGGVFVAGFFTSIAFFGARLSLARTYRDLLFGASSALMEIGILVCAERKGAKLRALRSDWSLDRDERRRIAGLRDVAYDERETRAKALRETEELIKRIEETKLKGRVFGTDVEANIKTAIAAVRAGYLAQVAENRTSGITGEEA